MTTPKLLWLYLTLAFGCLVVLTITLRANFEFTSRVNEQCRCQTKKSQDGPRYEATRIWNYVGIGALAILLVLLFVALYTEVKNT